MSDLIQNTSNFKHRLEMHDKITGLDLAKDIEGIFWEIAKRFEELESRIQPTKD